MWLHADNLIPGGQPLRPGACATSGVTVSLAPGLTTPDCAPVAVLVPVPVACSATCAECGFAVAALPRFRTIAATGPV